MYLWTPLKFCARKKKVLTFWRVFPRPVIYLVLLWEDRQSHQQRKKNRNRKQHNDRAFILFYFCYSDYFIKNPNMGSIFQRPKRSVRGDNPGNF